MTGLDWRRAWDLFEGALECDEAEIAAYLDEACAGDAALRRVVEELIAADRVPAAIVDRPVGVAPGGGRRSPEAGGDVEVADPLAAVGGGLPEGARLGAYRVQRRIGSGGMSFVYLAVRADDEFQRRVVLKLLRPGMDSVMFQRRLRTERQILAGLEHPYVARLYDGGTTDDGLPYVVMEYVEGLSIDEYCQRHGLTTREVLELFRKVCEAVHFAHQNLVVHRDIKPSNILVTAEGEPRLLDFGIAKLLNPEIFGIGELEATATWQRLLTPSHASPEQMRGERVTTASDVYSLGVLLYELLSGRLPRSFEGLSAPQVDRLLEETEPDPPSRVAAEGHPPTGVRLDGDLDAIVLKALRSSPRRRYGSVEQLDADLERYLRGWPVLARSGGWSDRLAKWARRNRRAVAGALAVFLMLTSFAVAMALQATRIRSERDEARLERDKKSQVLALVRDIFELSNPFQLPGEDLTVRQAVARSLPALEDGLEGQDEVRAELLHTAGSVLEVLGDAGAARDRLQEAFDLRRRLHGDAHADVAATAAALAAAHVDLGELDRGEELARRAVTISRALVSESPSRAHREVLLTSLNQLVSGLCHRAEFAAAREPAEEALALASVLPENETRRVAALEHLARVRSAAGDYAAAVGLNQEALDRRRRRDGDRHPGQIPTLNNLGLGLRRLGDLERAQQAYEGALALTVENFGREHVDPYLLNNLAGVLRARGAAAGAEALLLEGLAKVAADDPGHWLNFHFATRLAEARLDLGRAAEVEGDLRALLAAWEDRLGDHWRYAEARGVLGESLSQQGRCDAARSLLAASFEDLLETARERTRRDALERLRRHFGRCGDGTEAAPFEARLTAVG